MPPSFLDDGNYTLGMIRDVPSWQIPPGGTYDQLNLLNDRPGIVRQRMGSTALVSGSQTAFATSLGFCYSQDNTTIEELYGIDGKTGTGYVISKTTGAATSLGSSLSGASNSPVGRPVRHFGFIEFPALDGSTASRRVSAFAGATSSSTFTNSAAVAQVTAGNAQITLTGADVTTNLRVGSIIQLTTATQQAFYRVVSIDTTKLFTVWPTPVFTDLAVPASGVLGVSVYANTYGGLCVTSFQNRLLLGNTNDLNVSGAIQPTDRRVYYSPLPTETFLSGLGTLTISGAHWLAPPLWPKLNYFEVPGADPIVAMEPLDDNSLLILTANQPVIIDGDLATQLATTSPTITIDESALMQPAGCLSDLSVQRTPRGIVWAGVGGIYAYSGGREIKNLTGDAQNRRINTYWRILSTDATFVIHGSAYVRNHYIVSGTSGGTTFSFALNMDNLQWTRLSGVGTDIFLGVARPTNPAQVFALRWWDRTGAAPSMTNGQTLRLESMFAPYVSGTTTDGDGTAITSTLTTKTITGDPERMKTFLRGDVRSQVASTSAALAVTAQSTLDAADIDASRTRSLGSLSNTSTLTLSNATNANPIACTTTANHGLQTDDFVDIDAVLGNTNANGHWRITVTGATTFTLQGGIGNAAYISGGKVKKPTEQGYLLTPLNQGQGLSYSVTGAVNNVEIHGFRTAVLQRDPVGSPV